MTAVGQATQTSNGAVGVPTRAITSQSFCRQAWRRFRRNKAAMAGLAFCLLMFLVSMPAEWTAPHDPNYVDLKAMYAPPCGEYLLGADENGRDILSRVIYGGRITILVALTSVGVMLTIGVTVGLLGGYLGGPIDTILMNLTDAIMSFPVIFLLIVLAAFVGPSARNTVLVLGLTGWPMIARLVRGSVLSLREQEFVQAAVASGCSGWRVMWHHLLPNAVAPILVGGTLRVAWAILTEAALSFLGLGVPPPTPTWGNMLSVAQKAIWTAPHVIFPPGILIFLTVLSVNFVGDGLREALDPRLRMG